LGSSANVGVISKAALSAATIVAIAILSVFMTAILRRGPRRVKLIQSALVRRADPEKD
jgi:hypothetical protein